MSISGRLSLGAQSLAAHNGIVLIKAANMNAAADIAAGIPLAKLGIIEVRPIVGF
ncbi:MAG: YciI family protein [Candidatus Binataceae bacterium]